jgi:uncharacterized protein
MSDGPNTFAWHQPRSWPKPAQWLGLFAISCLISWLWGAAGFPAALLLGPMMAGILFASNGVRLTVPGWPFLGAQAAIGVLVATTISPAILEMLGHSSLLFGLVTCTTLVGAAAIGWLVSRTGLIPGATAVYGISPGAAGPMIVLAEAEGADPRLVAFMQYSRVLLVAVAAAVVARFWVGLPGISHAPTPWFGPVNWINLAELIALAIIGQQIARLIHLHAWGILGPMILLSALHVVGWIEIDTPRWLLAAAYVLLGWRIGLGFNRESLRHARRALPAILGSAVSLMALCGLLAWCLVEFAHVDALTAYLATSPGGLDSVAIIAASTPRADLPFVLASQTVRLFLVIALAPVITKLVVRHSAHLQTKISACDK